jgi:hypothetical protein
MHCNVHCNMHCNSELSCVHEKQVSRQKSDRNEVPSEMQTLYLHTAVTRLWHQTRYWSHFPHAISAKSKYWYCICFSTSLFRYWHLVLVACFQSSIFRQGAHDLRVRVRCKNIKMWLVIGGLVSVVLTVAVLLACGLIHLWGLMPPMHTLVLDVCFVIVTEFIVVCIEL